MSSVGASPSSKVEEAFASGEGFGVVLRKIARQNTCARNYRARKIGIEARDDAQQRRLSRAVPADDDEALAFFQHQIKVFDYRPLPVFFVDTGRGKHEPSRMRGRRKMEVHFFKAFGNLDPLEFFEPFYPVLNHGGLGRVVAEAPYEILGFGNLVLLFLKALDQGFKLGGANLFVLGIGAGIALEIAAEKLVHLVDR